MCINIYVSIVIHCSLNLKTLLSHIFSLLCDQTISIANSAVDTNDSYTDPSMEEQYQEEEAEDTLSFSDLPIYSDAADWVNFSKEDQSLSSSSSSLNQDFFEFFSEDWSTSSAYPVENIVFCGKLLTSKESKSDTELTHKIEISKQEKPRRSKYRLFRWNLKIFRRLRLSKSTNSKLRRSVSSSKSLSLPVRDECVYKVAKGGEKYGFSVRRVSIVGAPVRPRWHLMMFGSARMPAEMELSDIRSRQGRRSRSLVRQSGGDEKVRRGKGMWGAWWLIRVLGCGGYNHYGTATTTMQTWP